MKRRISLLQMLGPQFQRPESKVSQLRKKTQEVGYYPVERSIASKRMKCDKPGKDKRAVSQLNLLIPTQGKEETYKRNQLTVSETTGAYVWEK